MYHEVIDEADFSETSKNIQYSYILDEKVFKRQMEYLSKKGFRTLSLRGLHELLKDNTGYDTRQPCIVLSFDDGMVGNYEHVYPVLRNYGFTGIFYIISDSVGKKGMMSWDHIKEMSGSGMCFGSHTATHSQLGRMSPEDIFQELDRSKKTIEDNIGSRIEYLSLPHGSYNRDYKPAALEAGYLGGCTSVPGLNTPTTDPFFFKRMNVPRNRPLDYFISLCEKDSTVYKKVILKKNLLRFVKTVLGESAYLSLYNLVFGVKSSQ